METTTWLPFATPAAWRQWLRRNHKSPEGIWIRFYKKGSEVKSVNYAQALDEALCWGWIDGQSKSLDEISWIQKFTPRRPRSLWSKRNREHIARLTREGRMKPPGLEAVKAAKADGRWDQAYDSPANAKMPADFLKALKADPAAHAFYKTLSKSNTYAILWRLQTAKKPETRARRMATFLAMLARGEKLY